MNIYLFYYYQILIIDYKLTFPSGMATAVLINGFHNRGDRMAKYVIRSFLSRFCIFVPFFFFFSFIWVIKFCIIHLQEASERVPQVLLSQLLVGILSMVLQGQRGLRFFAVPYFRTPSMEANVILLYFFFPYITFYILEYVLILRFFLVFLADFISISAWRMWGPEWSAPTL